MRPMILGHGIDVVEIPRLAELLGRHGERFIERVFTAAERAYCRGKKRELEHLAGRFAAKEAVLKVLGTGWVGKISWQDIEVTNNPAGQPLVALSGESARVAGELGIRKVLVSISHTGEWAAASAIGLDEDEGRRKTKDGARKKEGGKQKSPGTAGPQPKAHQTRGRRDPATRRKDV